MNKDSVATGLSRVEAELKEWRGQRRKGDRIPEEIWRRAAQAARQRGVGPVSRALRLDYGQLKRRAEGNDAPKMPEGGPIFVEVGREQHKAGSACVVELAKGNGTRLRICVREAAVVDWGKLKEAFLGA